MSVNAQPAAAVPLRRPQASPAQPATPGEEETWLLGAPPLGRFLEFVDDTVLPEPGCTRAELAAAWRAANETYQALERTEAGIANQGHHRALDPHFEPFTAAAAAHPHYRRSFDTFEVGFEMVELDSLIVYQKHVTRPFVEALAARIGPAPAPEALFRFCFPLEAPAATPVHAQRVGSRRFVFRSPSTDFRFHEAALLPAELQRAHESFGAVAGIVGLVVGFGSNFLNAVRVGKRVLLNNGYHRACALRAAGLTHAPCIVQTVKRIDELALSVKSRVADAAEFYFESARPPLLRDFFDPRIRRHLPTRRRTRQIEISFEIRDYLLAE